MTFCLEPSLGGDQRMSRRGDIEAGPWKKADLSIKHCKYSA